MNNWIIKQKVDLAVGVNGITVWPNALMLEGDKRAHTWKVEILENGVSAEVNGNVRGYFVRVDGATAIVDGALEGNTASVTLSEECYAYEGDLKGIMQISDENSTITISALLFRVRSGYTSEIIDPGQIVPSLDDLLAELDNLRKATGEASSVIDAANTATKSANDAAESANSAAAKANSDAERAGSAAESANTAAQSANDAASVATEAAQGVEKAIEDANAATNAANQAAADAETQTNAAVKSAQETINGAVSDANEKIEEAVANAEAATQAANTAAGNANTAADGANVQANAAEQAAQSAGNAAGSAQTATEAAEEATRKALDAAERANNAASGAGLQKKVIDHVPEPSEMVEDVLYLVPAAEPNPDNVYDEYMLINDKRELIGSTAVDLSNYAKNEDVDAKLSKKLDATATAVAATKATQDGAGNNINTTYIKGISIESTTVTVTRGDNTTFTVTTQDTDTTYKLATNLALGLTKLYSETGSNEDGAMTQKAVTDSVNNILSFGEVESARKLANASSIGSNKWPVYFDGGVPKEIGCLDAKYGGTGRTDGKAAGLAKSVAINLTGYVTGGANFDGTNNVSISTKLAGYTYSLNEVETGNTWIDGLRIYRRVIKYNGTSSGNNISVLSSLTPSYIGTLVHGDVFLHLNANHAWYNVPFIFSETTSTQESYRVGWNIRSDTGFSIHVGTAYADGYTIIAILEYTKA